MENLSLQTEPVTFESILKSLKETAQNFKEAKEETEKLRQLFREADERRREEEKERQRKADESQREADERQRKENEESLKELKKLNEETWRQIRETSKLVGGIANSNGEVSESYFISCFENSMHFAGQDFDSMDSNLIRRSKKLNLQGEFDIVMYNGTSVAIIEIKYTVDKDDFESLLKKPKTFKQFFPQYENFDIYLGLAGLRVDASAEKEAKRQGVGIIKAIGKNIVIYDENLKVF